MVEDTADRQRWVDIEALLAEEAARPHSTLAEAAYSLWRTVDLLEDADTDVLLAEGADACRWGLGELGQMVDLLLRRQAAAVARVTTVLGRRTALSVPGHTGLE